MAIHLGYLRAGLSGLLVAGLAFILPAAVITGVIAALYVEYGTLPEVGALLYGIKPAVLALIAIAVGRLGGTVSKSWRQVALGLLVLSAVLAGLREDVALLVGGVGGMFWFYVARRNAAASSPGGGGKAALGAGLLLAGTSATPALAATGATGVALTGGVLLPMTLFFLKVGAILYGSGYVLLAFLQDGLVQQHAWMTERQLLDAVAAGQVTPGPLLSTATFCGYVIAGPVGAVLATVAIFLPSFVFVLLLNRILPRLREWKWTSAFLDAVNVTSVALMVAVTVNMGRVVLTTWPAWVIAGVATALGLFTKVNLNWLVLGGAAAGWLLFRLQ